MNNQMKRLELITGFEHQAQLGRRMHSLQEFSEEQKFFIFRESISPRPATPTLNAMQCTLANAMHNRTANNCIAFKIEVINTIEVSNRNEA